MKFIKAVTLGQKLRLDRVSPKLNLTFTLCDTHHQCGRFHENDPNMLYVRGSKDTYKNWFSRPYN